MSQGNRMLTAAEATKSFLDIGRKAMAEHCPHVKEGTKDYDRMLTAVLLGSTQGLFYGVKR